MEEELVVVSNSQFEWLRSRPGSEVEESGKFITRIESGVKKTFIRQRDWEKMQETFGPGAQAGRERIEKARASRYRETDETEPLLLRHEYALLRNATSSELESYVTAEEAVTLCQLEQRNILKVAGMRGRVWENEESSESFLHARLDKSSYEFHLNWPGWDALREALEDKEISLLQGLAEKIEAAVNAQHDVVQMVSARYIDSHPEEYPHG
jgi:hypothetical protein